MHVMKRAPIGVFTFIVAVASFHGALGQAFPYRGLWVGDVNLTRVNEVTAAYDENNTLISPDPKVPTPTSDAAQLRLILHVDGVGQVRLLKDVAVLNRATDTDGVAQSDSDISLVTDERLYGEYPPQPALRVASAIFDFCDSRATEALDAVVSNAAVAAAAAVEGNASLAAATIAALSNAMPVVAHADVSDAFYHFIMESFKGTSVTSIAQAANPTNAALSAWLAASNLQSSCLFYPDSRGVDMIHAVVAAVSRAGTGVSERVQAAQNAAASYADVSATYQRFIAGKSFGDMIVAAGADAAIGATNSGATAETLRIAVNSNAIVNAVSAQAAILQANNSAYSDTRASTAVEIVLTAVIHAAMAARTNVTATQSSIKIAAEQAGRLALASDVARYPVSIQIPTLDYTAFVSSPTGFLQSAGLAATNAAKAAMDERTSNALWTPQSLLNKAFLAASAALQDLYREAARAVRTELPLLGAFGPGLGDPRLTWDIKNATNALPLGAQALSGEIYLPANYPTNPFRHRRHPDHTTGFDIRRFLQLSFDGTPTNVLQRAGFGVERITGTYREEVFGLHKPLGAFQDTGLRVEGTFELNRISLIDTLNAQ